MLNWNLRLACNEEAQSGQWDSRRMCGLVCELDGVYAPPHAEENIQYSVVSENLETFVAMQQQRERTVPRFVERDIAHKRWEEAREAAGYPWLRIHDLVTPMPSNWPKRDARCISLARFWVITAWEFTRRQYAKFSPESAANAVRNYQISADLPLSAY